MPIFAPRADEWGRISPCRKFLTTLWAVSECLLFSGIIYGWHSLLIVFKEDGIFHYLCEESNFTINDIRNVSESPHSSVTCAEQDDKFNLVFMLCAILMTTGCAVFGYMQYLWGTQFVKIIDLLLFQLGILCVAFMDRGTSWLLFIGAPAIATAGPPLFLTNIQVANLYDQGSAFVVCLCTGAYEVSAAIQLLVKYAYYAGISRMVSYMFLSCLQLLILVGIFFIFPKTYIPKSTEKASTIEDKETEDNVISSLNQYNTDHVLNENRGYQPPSLAACIKSTVFLLHVLWICLLQLRFYFYVGSLNTYLEYVTDGDQQAVDVYTSISLYIQLAGAVGAPLMGFFLTFEHRRYRATTNRILHWIRPNFLPLMVTCLLAVVLSGVILFPITSVLIPVFVAFTFFRSFVYGLASAIIQSIFPSRYFGTLWGLTMIVGGLFSALQYPLFIWMNTTPVDPFKVNMLLLFLSCLSLIYPFYIWLLSRRSTDISKTEHIGSLLNPLY